MAKKVLILLAEGFEEMEAVISIDILRRAGLDVVTVAIGGDLLVRSARNVTIKADVYLKNYEGIPDAVVLPGGTAGAERLAASEIVIDLIKTCTAQGKTVAAICAAPAIVLPKTGVLDGKRATCYTDCETMFNSQITFVKEDVVVDGNIITSAGPGTAIDFALAVVEVLLGEEIVAKLKEKALIK
ncbi:MAG: DJ-1/PfpI family protein [PVC group bacterium]|nr:DJ-1/PfpI family protein [PVC group bacterium]